MSAGVVRVVRMILVGASCVCANVAGAQATAPFVLLDSALAAHAPASLARRITLVAPDITRRDAVRALIAKSGTSVVFDPSLPGLDDHIEARYENASVAVVLLGILDGSAIRAMVSPSAQVVLVARPGTARGTRRLIGWVRDTAGALSQARVELLGTRHGATTREDGSFVLTEVPAGDYTLRATRLGYTPVMQEHLRIGMDDPTSLQVQMSRGAIPLAAVVVTPGYFGLLQSSAAATQSMTREQLETVPQIGEDIYRAINRLPGVSANDFSARFSVRGATADQLRVTLDGLRLIEPFHLKDIGSALSIIDIQSLGDASLTSGGASAAFGDQVGGVFAMRSIDPRSDRPRSSVGVSLTNFRATSQGTFDEGKGGWLASGRRGFLDLAFKFASLGDSLEPKYHDLFAKVQHELPGNGEIAVHALHSGDDLLYLDVDDQTIDSRYLATYLWTTWSQRITPRLQQELVLSSAWLDWRRNGDVRSALEPASRIADTRSLRSVDLRQDWSLDIAEPSLLTFGFDVRNEAADYDYSRRTLRESVTPAHQLITTAESLLVRAQPRGTAVGVYVSHRLRPVDALTIETGLRYDRSGVMDERILSPRAAASWQVASGTTVRAAWGLYAQSQQIFALQAEDGVRSFSPADRSDQRELGLEQQLPWRITGTVDVYDRRLTYERPRFVNGSSRISPFPEISYDREAIPASSGRSKGLELQLALPSGSHAEWSASYALAKITDQIGSRAVPRVSDQRHTAHVDWSWHPSTNRWRVTVAGVWHSGTPDTPQTIRIDTLVNTPNQFSFHTTWLSQPLYSSRVDDYRRIDLRWTQFVATANGRVSFFVEAFNVLNNANARGTYRNVGVNGRTLFFVDGVRNQLPRIPSAGVTWEF